MRRLSLLLVCIGLTAAFMACGSDDQNSPSDAPKTNTEARSGKTYKTDPIPAPNLDLKTLNGETINLADQDGKVLLVNFWATWCAPCRKEIPDLIDLHEKYKSDGLRVIGVATDQEGMEAVKPFVDEQNITYPIVLDTSKTIQGEFDQMYGLPTTYVVNPDGKIVRRVLGIFPVEEMRPTLTDMLQSDKGEKA